MNDSIKKIAAGATAGTGAMSAFSYIATDKENKEFREPAVLGTLVRRLIPSLDQRQSRTAGWLLHYGAGVLFTTAYHELWKTARRGPSPLNGLIIGGISGLIGVAVWQVVFTLHPAPPKLSKKSYYGHLLLAHLVFGLGAAIGYRKA